jgi:undecaprenyl-diphosphatase
MTLLEGIILGIVQGLTEFLPISSTAHLTLVGKFLGITGTTGATAATGATGAGEPEAWTATMAVMQLGTITSVLIYFRNDLIGMLLSVLHDLRLRIAPGAATAEAPPAGALPAGESPAGRTAGRPPIGEPTRLALLIALGTIPVVVAGLLLEDIIEGPITKDTRVIATSLIGVALVLWLAEKKVRHTRTMSDKRWTDALVIGAAQALALTPGSSRSGTTMAAALFLRFTRESAARFSFLLSIPAVVASGLYQAVQLDGVTAGGKLLPMIVATVVSGISGYAAIGFLLTWLKKRTMLLFVWYRLILGAALLLSAI